MCGRYAMNLAPKQVRDQLETHNLPVNELKDGHGVKQSLNVAPQSVTLVYHVDRHNDNTNDPSHGHKEDDKSGHATSKDQNLPMILETMKWTLQPFYAKEPVAYPTFNTRAESLSPLKPAWRCATQHRGIVFMQGYYEWRHMDDGRRKVPYYITSKNGELICTLVIWDVNPKLASTPTYSIVTTTAATQLQFIHPRMPASVGWEDALKWITAPWPQCLECIRSNPDLMAWEVSPMVNKVGVESANLTKPVPAAKPISSFFGQRQSRVKDEPHEEEANATLPEIKVAGKQKRIPKTDDKNGSLGPCHNTPALQSNHGIKRENSESDSIPDPSENKHIKLFKLSEEMVSPNTKSTSSPPRRPNVSQNASPTKHEKYKPITAYFAKQSSPRKPSDN